MLQKGGCNCGAKTFEVEVLENLEVSNATAPYAQNPATCT